MKLAIRNPFKKQAKVEARVRPPVPVIQINAAQLAVVFVINAIGGSSTDANLVTAYLSMRKVHELPEQSPSGIRTRRSELVKLGCLVESGSFRVDSGHYAKVWGIVDCHVGVRPPKALACAY